MTPQQFLSHIKQQPPLPVYLFAGPEPYQREWCIKGLVERMFPDPGERAEGVVRQDLEETSLESVLDDACCFSLFVSRRLILVSNAEAAMPRAKAGAAEDDEAVSRGEAAKALARYLASPVEGVTVVFDAAKYDFHGDDKKKLERVRKFYEGIQAVVEFPRMTPPQARQAAEKHARRIGLEIGTKELDLLVEALGADAARIATEMEKLALYATGGRKIGPDEIAELVPEARESTIFALVGALGRKDRAASLGILDTLVRQSEYLPLALSFLATQFRMALMAREAGLRNARDIQFHFQKLGIPMWGSRAEQVHETASQFSKAQLTRSLETIYAADKALRDARPDDRVVMEEFILRLTTA